MISATAIGYLGKDAVLKDVNGKSVVNFSIAHSEKYLNAQQVKVEKTTWIECSMWDMEKVAPFLKKGTQVYIAGQPESRGWIDKDGNAQSNLHVRVLKLELLGGKKEDSANTASTTVEPEKENGKKKTAREIAKEAALGTNDD